MEVGGSVRRGGGMIGEGFGIDTAAATTTATSIGGGGIPLIGIIIVVVGLHD